MDFIERWLHVAPDGGDGTLEVFYLIVITMVTSAFVFRRQLLGLIRRPRATNR